jgi:hypothetical protein
VSQIPHNAKEKVKEWKEDIAEGIDKMFPHPHRRTYEDTSGEYLESMSEGAIPKTHLYAKVYITPLWESYWRLYRSSVVDDLIVYYRVAIESSIRSIYILYNF